MHVIQSAVRDPFSSLLESQRRLLKLLVSVPSFVQRVQDSFCHVDFQTLEDAHYIVTTLSTHGQRMQ